jgi:uncharacterized LabA/DUF88 family protein
MNRTNFIIDGFNIYHSVVDASKHLQGASTKWLNLYSLCESYLHIIGNNAKVENIYYFSALATHLSSVAPQKIEKHKTFIRALKETGVIVELVRFKPKKVWCDKCNSHILKHEEKESDVAIASKLLEVLILDECDSVVLITGDTDVAPAVRTSQKLFPEKNIIFGFPYRRRNNELVNLASKHFKISKENILKHQFPNPLILSNGEKLFRPKSW